jgi:hypothetical protein
MFQVYHGGVIDLPFPDRELVQPQNASRRGLFWDFQQSPCLLTDTAAH